MSQIRVMKLSDSRVKITFVELRIQNHWVGSQYLHYSLYDFHCVWIVVCYGWIFHPVCVFSTMKKCYDTAINFISSLYSLQTNKHQVAFGCFHKDLMFKVLIYNSTIRILAAIQDNVGWLVGQCQRVQYYTK